MNSKNSFHLKLIPNFSYSKEKLSVALRNKDFYLFNLLHKKSLKERNALKLSNNNNNRTNVNEFKRPRKLIQIKELNMNNLFAQKKIKSKNYDESNKNIENYFNNFFIKTQRKTFRHNSSFFLIKDKMDIEPLNNIKNSLIITSLFKNNINTKEKNKEKKKKLKKIKKSFTLKILNKEEIEKLKANYFLSNSIIKNEAKKTRKNEGTQFNMNFVNYHNMNAKKNKMIISRNSFCSPKSIIFQKEFDKYKSVDSKRYF